MVAGKYLSLIPGSEPTVSALDLSDCRDIGTERNCRKTERVEFRKVYEQTERSILISLVSFFRPSRMMLEKPLSLVWKVFSRQLMEDQIGLVNLFRLISGLEFFS